MRKHPAKFSDDFIPIFYDLLIDTKNVLDPMSGVGKIAQIIELGYKGKIYCNELEPEWANQTDKRVYLTTTFDARDLPHRSNFFDAICTSPVFGNRASDAHIARDKSKRITYTHLLGRRLTTGNTGSLQWGEKYRQAHREIWTESIRVLKPGGIFILNVSDHIRKGEVMPVSAWHKDFFLEKGFSLEEHIKVETKRMRFGVNSHLRVPFESIFVFKKGE